MTRTVALLFFALAMVIVCLPAVAVSLGRTGRILLMEETAADRDRPPETEEDDENRQVRLFVVERQEVISLDLESYLVGVLMAEMPASFELEALKAQAVVARTYTLRRLHAVGDSGCDRGLQPADICSDSAHCQAWVDPETAVYRWPAEQRNENLMRIKQAVQDTAGEVAVYQGRLIEAVYHSTCGGRTEASGAIWSGGFVPYLQSVECPYCFHSPHHRKEILLPFDRLEAAFEQQLALPAGPGDASPVQIVSTTPGRRVGLLRVNDARINGKDVRRLLELPSTAFTLELRADGALFFTRGHGHGVGLCQYGADGAAARGKTYREIISFYYPGATVVLQAP